MEIRSSMPTPCFSNRPGDVDHQPQIMFDQLPRAPPPPQVPAVPSPAPCSAAAAACRCPPDVMRAPAGNRSQPFQQIPQFSFEPFHDPICLHPSAAPKARHTLFPVPWGTMPPAHRPAAAPPIRSSRCAPPAAARLPLPRGRESAEAQLRCDLPQWFQQVAGGSDIPAAAVHVEAKPRPALPCRHQYRCPSHRVPQAIAGVRKAVSSTSRPPTHTRIRSSSPATPCRAAARNTTVSTT